MGVTEEEGMTGADLLEVGPGGVFVSRSLC